MVIDKHGHDVVSPHSRDGNEMPGEGSIHSTKPILAHTDAEAIPGLTEQTLIEAEKIHVLSYTSVERQQILSTLPSQIASVKAIRAVPKDRALMPALTFDPRLPGKRYPAQPNHVRLKVQAPENIPAEPASIAFAAITEQGHWLRTGQISSRLLTEIYLERIARIAPQLQCFVTVTAERALTQAAAADREIAAGRIRSPLHGIPYGLKDVFDTAGVPTTWGTALYRDRVPEEDSTVAALLGQAGAVLLGKVATAELAIGSRWFGGDTRNPWNIAESASGSSTGSGSATAAGLVGFSIGTDSLGSILNPSDRCGVTGLRATFGRVPTRGSMPLTPSLSRIGPITRAVEDAALVMAAINHHDPHTPGSIDIGFAYQGDLDLSKLKVGYEPQWFETVGFSAETAIPASEAHRNVLRVLKDLGVELVEIKMPKLPIVALLPILSAEAAMVFEDLTLSNRDDELVTQDLVLSWPNAWREIRLMSAIDYLQADRVRRLLMESMDRVFAEVDILCGPLHGESIALMTATNMTGHPGLTTRVGFADLPTRTLAGTYSNPNGARHRVTQNIALHGRLFEEGTLLALARALEERLDVWRERPPVG